MLGFKLPFYQAPTLLLSLGLSVRVLWYLLSKRPDVIHVSSPGLLVFSAVLYAKLLSIPLVVSYHTHIPEYIPRYTWKGLVAPMWSIIRWCTRMSDLTLVTSKAMMVRPATPACLRVQNPVATPARPHRPAPRAARAQQAQVQTQPPRRVAARRGHGPVQPALPQHRNARAHDRRPPRRAAPHTRRPPRRREEPLCAARHAAAATGRAPRVCGRRPLPRRPRGAFRGHAQRQIYGAPPRARSSSASSQRPCTRNGVSLSTCVPLVAVIGVPPRPHSSSALVARHPPARAQGMMKGEELSQAYASGDVFVMPSESETLGFVVLEAMASQVPVVCVAAGGLTDIVTAPGTNGAGSAQRSKRQAECQCLCCAGCAHAVASARTCRDAVQARHSPRCAFTLRAIVTLTLVLSSGSSG